MKQNAPDWEDMSDFVVHFTKPTKSKLASNDSAIVKKTPYQNIISILYSGRIEAKNAFGIGKKLCPDEKSQRAICFSEIPLHLLKRLTKRRGPYAIGFAKKLVVKRGGGPIMYAYKGSDHEKSLRTLMRVALSKKAPAKSKAIWSLTPFVDAPGDYWPSSYYFEWEREWRHLGDFKFSPDDVAFLVIPEKQHKSARTFFENARDENLGPAYLCPYIDPNWSIDKVREALKDLTAP